MVRDYFRVLRVQLESGRGEVVTLEGRDKVAGGSGLAALLFEKYGHAEKPWNDPDQPLIFAIGPLDGVLPLDEQNRVRAFKSPLPRPVRQKATREGGRPLRCGLPIMMLSLS